MGLSGSKTPVETRILMLGLDGSGKSTLLYKLIYNEEVFTVPTVGFNVEMLETKEKALRVLSVWDVGGQLRMRPHWKHYYQDTAGLVFVVDSRDRRRLGEARRELQRLLSSEFLRGLPLVILANKQDLTGALSAEDITKALSLKELCGQRDWFVQPCSGRTGQGLEDSFRRMLHFLKTSVKRREGITGDKGMQNLLRRGCKAFVLSRTMD